MKLHHVGYVVPSISEMIQSFAESLSAEWDGRVTLDPLQQVHVAFLRSRSNPAETMVELVAPAAEQSPVTRFLSDGGGLHHLCYEVADLDEQLQRAQAYGGLVVRKPLPAVAFDNRRIAWVHTRHKLLVEYLERKLPHGAQGTAE